jgi:twinfilin-like protein
MLYASTRASLFKGLGSTLFTDSIFATSKTDLTAEAYAAHLKHLAAPKPLSAREQEIADLRLAESGTASLHGSRARINHIGTGVGFNWSIEAEEAVTALARGIGCALVVVVSSVFVVALSHAFYYYYHRPLTLRLKHLCWRSLPRSQLKL